MTVDADSVQKNAGHYFAEELPDAFYSYLQEQDQRQMAKLQYDLLIMEEKQTIVACGAGSVSKRVYPDGRIERCENVKDVASFIERIDEMIERKRKLLGD